MKMEQSVMKRRHIKFTCRGITQKKEYNKNKVTNYFKRLIAKFEFARCLKQEAKDMKFHRYANLRNVQCVLFNLCIIDNRLATLTQKNTQIIP